MDLYVIIVLFLELALALYLLWRERLITTARTFIIPAILLLLSTFIKANLFDYCSIDYYEFLAPWIEHLREIGFVGISDDYANYNPPYMYFLWLFSLLPLYDLYLIKLFSILFDVLLAWAATKLLSLCTQNRVKLFFCFFSLLLLPTFITNSSMWGQCDSIYSFFGVYSLYLALTDKPLRSMACIAASLAFKLQAVFVMPVFVILLIAKKLKPIHFLAFPIAYAVYLLPSVIAGRGFIEAMTLYLTNVRAAGSALNYNAPSLTSFFDIGKSVQIDVLLVFVAFVFMFAVLGLALLRRSELNSVFIVVLTALLVIGIPYLLPHMHDRYFYLAGVFTVMLACYNPKYIAMPLLAELASFHCYYAYLSRHYIVDPKFGGLAMLIVLIMAIIFVLTYKSSDRQSIFD